MGLGRSRRSGWRPGSRMIPRGHHCLGDNRPPKHPPSPRQAKGYQRRLHRWVGRDVCQRAKRLGGWGSGWVKHGALEVIRVTCPDPYSRPGLLGVADFTSWRRKPALGVSVHTLSSLSITGFTRVGRAAEAVPLVLVLLLVVVLRDGAVLGRSRPLVRGAPP